MDINQYWVGDIPEPIRIDVRDSYGRPKNLSGYTGFRAILLDPRNSEVDTTGATLDTAGAINGQFRFIWPTAETVLTRSGEYLLQLELIGPGVKTLTTAHPIRVRQLGGIN